MSSKTIQYHVNEIIVRITCTKKNKLEFDIRDVKEGNTEALLYKSISYLQLNMYLFYAIGLFYSVHYN